MEAKEASYFLTLLLSSSLNAIIIMNPREIPSAILLSVIPNIKPNTSPSAIEFLLKFNSLNSFLTFLKII